MIRLSDHRLKETWKDRFQSLPPEARSALRDALLDLRKDAAERAKTQWNRNKAPMAFYWKVVSVYAGHFARALRRCPFCKDEGSDS
jgi:hypothetical protein